MAGRWGARESRPRESRLEEALRGELAAARRGARWAQLRVERELARTAHDLKAPLAAAKGYVEMMLRGMAGPLPPGAARYLERIREVIDGERRLIDERLRLPGDRGDLAAVCDLGGALRAALARSRPAVQARGLEVRARLPADGSPLLARPSLLSLFARRLVRHLVGAASAGGAVLIAVHDELPRWEVEAWADGDRRRIGRDLLVCRESVNRLGGSLHLREPGRWVIEVQLPQEAPGEARSSLTAGPSPRSPIPGATPSAGGGDPG
jgi:signal transduction histidine kinase